MGIRVWIFRGVATEVQDCLRRQQHHDRGDGRRATTIRSDLLIALMLCTIAFGLGRWYVNAFASAGEPNPFGQHEFGAAVTSACGRGFIDPGYSATPALASFLEQRSDTYSCADLPASLPTVPPNLTQRLYRYLMYSVALVWRVRGISWSGLSPLFGALFGLTVAATYALFRLGAPRSLACLLSVAVMISPIHLGMLPYLRDYAKAPFMLLLLLLMARFVAEPATPRRTILYAAAFGSLLGLGFGFRNDLLLNIPAFIIVTLLALPGSVFSNLRLKGVVLLVATGCFLLVAWPILGGYGAGSNTGHVAFLGLMSSFDPPLGIHGSFYDWGYSYLDGFAGTAIDSYAYRVHGHHIAYLSKEYDRIAIEYIARIALTWPADIVTRAYAALLRVLDMPFTFGKYAYSVPIGMHSSTGEALYRWQIWFMQRLDGWQVPVTILSLLMISAATVRGALVLLLLLLYYGGSPAIQFDVRHFFYLEFIGWWSLGFVVTRSLSFVWNEVVRRRHRNPRSGPAWPRLRAQMIRTATFTVIAVTVVVGGVTVLRAYQFRHVHVLLHDLEAAPRERLQTTSIQSETTLVSAPSLWAVQDKEAARDSVLTRYIVAEFSGATCPAIRLPVTFRYSAESKPNDFSREMVLDVAGHSRPTHVLLTVFSTQWGRFEGIEVPNDYATCVTALYRLTDVSGFVVIPNVVFTSRWEEATPFQTIAALEHYSNGAGVAVHVAMPNQVVPRAAMDDRLSPLSDMAFESRLASSSGDGAWHLRGRPDVPDAPLLRFNEQTILRHDLLIAEGELRRGGFSVALGSAGQRVASVRVREKGAFLVALEAPRDDAVSVTISNDIAPWWPASHVGHRIGPLLEWLPGMTLQNDLVIRRIGWLRRPG